MTNARTARSAREKAAQLRQQAEAAERRRRGSLIGSAVLAVLLVVTGVGVLIQSMRSDAGDVTASGTPRNLDPGGGTGTDTTGGIVVGRADAPVTVTLYEDFQCPACQSFEAETGGLLAKWVSDGTVRLDYRPIAILDRASTTRYSTRALNAAAAVVDSRPEAFQKFHDLLYTNQPAEGSAGLPDGQLVELAGQAGADADAVRRALADRRFETWAATVTDAASQAGIQRTPTVKINGTELTDLSAKALTAAVEAAKSAKS